MSVSGQWILLNLALKSGLNLLKGFEAAFLEVFGENKSITKKFMFSALKHMVWPKF